MHPKYSYMLSVLVALLLCGCAVQSRKQFEIDQNWSPIITKRHADAALHRAPNAVNCGAYDLTQVVGQRQLPTSAHQCIKKAVRQNLSYRLAIVRVTGDVTLQTAVVYDAALDRYWYASLDTLFDGSEWGLNVERCRQIEIEPKPLFFDARDCEPVDAESWWAK